MRFQIAGILLLMVTLTSCDFNQSVNKDLKTGAYSRGDGLGCDDITIQISEDVVSRTDYVFGEKVDLVFNDIRGFTKVGDKNFPGLSVRIIKNEKDTVAYEPDLFVDLTEGSDFDPLKLTAFFRANFEYQNTDKFEAHIEIWDKKGDGTFNYELPFTIVDNELLTIDSQGIDYSAIYLWNETLKQPVFNGNVNSEHVYYLLVTGAQGLDQIDNKIFPAFSIEIKDNKGNLVLANPDLFSELAIDGVDPNEVKAQVYAKINFAKGQINNPYRLNAKLTDNKSSKQLSITGELQMN